MWPGVPGTSVKPYVERSTLAACEQPGGVLGGERDELDVATAQRRRSLGAPLVIAADRTRVDTGPPRAITVSHMFAGDDILPPDPEGLDVLHDREYRVRAFRLADDRILIRGAVRDQKPPGVYLADDPDPLTMHHMVVDLTIAFPSMVIEDVEMLFEAHPHTTCVDIIDAYQGLVGLSITRGFTHKVRELLGGPRGCTHTTALLLAMGPVATQCTWSMYAEQARREGTSFMMSRAAMTPEERALSLRANLNTCHVWAEDGELMTTALSGEPIEMMLQIRKRFESLGIPEEEWANRV